MTNAVIIPSYHLCKHKFFRFSPFLLKNIYHMFGLYGTEIVNTLTYIDFLCNLIFRL